MRLARILKRHFSKQKTHCASSLDRPTASNFALESLEPRLLLSATPVPTAEMPAAEPAAAAIVTTDKADYSPGETAVITTSNTTDAGAKFADGEMVQFQVTRTDGVQDFPDGNLPWYVTDGVGGFEAYQEYDAAGQAVDRNNDGQADWIRPDNDLTVNGSISTTWFVEDQYLNSTLKLTATGQESGTIATTEFTDSPRVGSVAVVTQTSQITAGVGGTTSYTFNVFRGTNNNNPQTATVAITGLPSGVTVANLTQSITLSGTGNQTTSAYTGTFDLIVPAALSSNSYNFNVIVTSTQPQNGGDNATGIGTLVVSPSTVATTTTVSSSLNSSTYGDSVTFTATVARSAGTGAPTGSVNFTIQGIGTVAGTAGPTTATTATWTYTTSALTAGSHTVSASFVGTGAFTNSSTTTPLTQNVNQKHITGNFTADNKVYDGLTGAVVLTRTLNDTISGDVVSLTGGTANFADKNVGTGKTVTLTGASLSGTDAGNYILDSVATTTANITPATVTASIVGNPTKTYDGNTDATLTAGNFSLTGVVTGESFTVTKTTGTYNSKDVATANTVSTTLAAGDFTAGAGTLASNYVLPTTASGAGHITQATLTGVATTQSALNIAKQGSLVFSLDNISGMADGETVASLLSSMTFTLKIGANTYAFAPSVAIDTHGDLNPSNDTVVVTYSLKNGGDAGQLAADLQALNLADGTASTSASNAQVAAIWVNMSTANYTFSDDALTKLFNSTK